ncbi:interferon-induced very large GTPase 1-like [Kryptolebias marmoratus]|uniref:interferon-induced very large GTPase 1-like n=1 Tax=Kryptolebias marmoratus TaxID=37003 RepID=UPI0018ACDC50|nr:interferon-induced very large GTPase 1-like [Kryptolebias marmoratus]
MMKREEFSTRMSFQYSVLLDLLSKNDFNSFRSYSHSYESYVKSWISERIKEHFSEVSTICEFEDSHVQTSIDNINDAIKTAKAETTDSLKTFVENICKELGDKLVISQDALGAFMILNNADQEQFAHWLTESVKDIKEALSEKFKKTTIETKLRHLQMNPQNELFNRVIGCGKQCPFCKVPCDAGGREHTKHFASLHRPQGFGNYSWIDSDKLVTDICSSSVISDKNFHCSEMKNKRHPFKDYRKIFPDWDIPPDRSLEASDFWKFVMTKYNNEFAEAYKAKPADIPKSWRKITEQQAKESLKYAFEVRGNYYFPIRGSNRFRKSMDR